MLLELEPSRIKLRDLPIRLGIERTEWLFDCYEDPLCYSRDRQSLVALSEFENVLATLHSQAEERFVNLLEYVKGKDVDISSLRLECGGERNQLCYFSARQSDPGFVATKGLVDRTRQELRSTSRPQPSKRLDVSELLPDVPIEVLRLLVEEVKLEDEIDVDLETRGGKPILVPRVQEVNQQAEFEIGHTDLIHDLASHLHEHGYCLLESPHLPTGKLQDDVVARLETDFQSARTDITLIETESGASVFVTRITLDSILTQLKTKAESLAISSFAEGGRSFNGPAKTSLEQSSSKPGMTKALLQSHHLETIEAAWHSTIARLEAERRQKTSLLRQETIMIPISLYILGLAQDATLREHQEDYLGEHFRREVIPEFIEHARRLASDKAASRDLDKLAATCAQAKTLTEVQHAVSKFAKKQKIDAPTSAQIAGVKAMTLQTKLKDMVRMTRGSDVLQNTIWILLAAETDGLYMSSGKDTGRMIKLYQQIGAEHIGMKLDTWRALLKAGKETREDLQEMRELAMRTIEEKCPRPGD